MLNALKKERLTNVAVVVTRYFGGVKLGVRGLIDAYGSAVEEGIKQSELQPIIPHSIYKLTIPYDFFDTLKHRLNEFNPRYDEIEYSTDISLHLSIESVSKESVEHFLKDWQQAGRINFTHLLDTDD
jgi:putative IMPACT (imprinted ancient) family translation regulator